MTGGLQQTVRALIFRFGWSHEAAARLTATTAGHWAEEASIFIERNRSR